MTETTALPVTLTTGLDLGDRTTHYCTLDAQRQIGGRGKFATTRDSLVREFGGLPRRRLVIEAGSQSLWVSHPLTRVSRQGIVPRWVPGGPGRSLNRLPANGIIAGCIACHSQSCGGPIDFIDGMKWQ